jgi:hypothetical protein
MSRLRTAAAAVYLFGACGTAIWGGIYLARSQFLPYHSEAIGMSWQSLPANTQVLFLALIHVAGAFGVSLGCAVASLVLVPFRRAEAWAEWTIPAVLLYPHAAALAVTSEVARKTGAHTPWQVALTGIAATILGVVLCRLDRRRAKD